MDSNFPRDGWQASGRGQEPHQRQGWDWRDETEFEPPASDSQQLRQFAQAYEEQARRASSPTVNEADEIDVARGLGSRVVVGLVAFVLLLAVAIALALLFSRP